MMLMDETKIDAIENEIDAKTAINVLIAKIRDYQLKVQEIVSNYYLDFLPNCYDNVKIMKNGKLLEDEINKAITLINKDSSWQLYMTNERMQQQQEELSECITAYKTAYKLQTIHGLFDMIPRCGDDYQKLIHIIEKVKALLDDGSDAVLLRLDGYHNIRSRCHEEYQILLFNLNKKFESLVQLREKPFQNTKAITINIKKDEDQLHQVVLALIHTNYNIHKLCSFLMNNVFEPIITRPVLLVYNENDGDFISLQLSYQLKSNEDLRPNYKIIFQLMIDTFYCLGHMNIVISDRQCIFSIIAKHTKSKICRLLIDNCLQNDIPDTIDEMNDSNIVQAVQEFNKFLRDMLFLDGESDSMLDEYASKIELLFQKKFCANIVSNAFEIMKKDLHDMVLVEDRESDFSCGSDMFASCMVSKSTIELKKLLDKVLSEGLNGERKLSDRLMETIATVLERYTIEVTQIHEKLLLKIPQQSALFHNNCMYLSFWLQKNASKLDANYSFMLIGNALRDQGNKTFHIQLQNQRTLLMQSLREFDLTNGIVELSPKCQKAIRQCIRQFELLKSVWQTVLPEMVYNNSVGSLLTTFCTEIIKRILLLEDITAALGNGLVTIIKIIEEKVPFLLRDHTDITLLVKPWTKLLQLHKILDSSLVEITELWAEGKGPLTLNYKADEVKHLIRALFQNTNHRQMSLASIIQL
ncbi:centromere/kinetochore protein zw10 [Wyeomyia smithii]|uniref:centromere/kinetochore protein zw10 n=1 Tax=Wyeomyia smithii TaxID=174621 RepID=UPI002467E277|nr:centromere/kinetochore protein zw10 [Wyeomyia smithii]